MVSHGWFEWEISSAQANYFFYKLACLFNVFSQFRWGDVELFFKASVKETGVVKPRNIGDVGNGIGGGKQKIFCVIQTLG